MIRRYEPHNPQPLPDLQMLSDELNARFWEHELFCPGTAPGFHSFQLYRGQSRLRKDTLYLLDGEGEGFPRDEYSYAAALDLAGKAPHIRALGRSTAEIANRLNEIFLKYLDFELELRRIVIEGDLTELCQVGSDFFQNPMYIHDSGFTILAQPFRVDGMVGLDYNPNTGRSYLPLWLVEEFKFNQDYLDTLSRREAGLWGTEQYPYQIRSLYVNIWDGELYRGRLLINELYTELQPGQRRLAERLADYAREILRRDEQQANRHYRDFEDTFKALIDRKDVDRTDLEMLLSVLGWKETDRFVLCLLQSQDERLASAGEQTVRNQLSATLKGTFSFFYEGRLCMVTDLDAADTTLSGLRSRVAPVVRDSLLFAGASFAVEGVELLGEAFRQALFALEEAFRRRDGRWFLAFEDCALRYALTNAGGAFTPGMLAAPALQRLRRHDREKGTEYYRTLRVYLEQERSIPRASAALIIHRSTLEYRLEKIRALTELDLEDEEQRLYLLLSFRLLAGEGEL